MIYGVTDQIDLPSGNEPPPDTAYSTSAVHFNGSTFLSRGGSLTGWGPPSKCTAVIWTKLTAGSNGTFGDGNFFHQGSTGDGGGNFYVNMQCGDTYFDAFGNAKVWEASPTWQGILIACDISGGTKLARLYKGDTDVFFNDDFSPGSNTDFGSISDFFFGSDGFSKITGDIADFRLWVDQYLDISIENNRRYFVRPNGKPADPTYANALLGTPIVSFIGNSTNFPINGGTGGSFSVTGSLSNAGTSPTD